MPIPVSCPCGKKLNAPDNMAGKRAKCPGCKQSLSIPDILEIVEDSPGLPDGKIQKQTPALSQPPSSVKENPKPAPAGSRAGMPRPAPAETRPGSTTSPKPVLASTSPAERFANLITQIDRSFARESIPAVRPSLGYRLAILVVAFLMILLPLLYLAIIAGVGYGIWYHAVNHTAILTGGATGARAGGKVLIFALMVYATPIIAGVIMILFMLKPLFARTIDNSGRRSLKKEEEPLLFDFVSRICEAVGSPKPRRIDIDCDVNASAGFRNGYWSFLGNDLVLTVGMPLAAGMTMRQFGGVLAHEFGHFSQGAGMRLSFVIRGVNFWFIRIVYERDQWDEKLKSLAGTEDFRIGWIFQFARFCVWLNRKLLWCLMMVGHFFSGVLMRQMEFDADRYEARFGGSKTFASTARQLMVLNLSNNAAISDLGDFYREGRLGDDLPKLIRHRADQMPADVHKKIDQEIKDSRTGLFDTHPADSARIANANRENTEGIFRLELPAAELFKDFDKSCRAVTWDFYKEIFGKELKKADLHPVEGLLERQKTEIDTHEALGRFHQARVSLYRPVTGLPEVAKKVTDPQTVIQALKDARSLQLELVEDFAKAWKKYDDADTRLIETKLAKSLLAIDLPIEPNDFSIPLANSKQVEVAQRKAVERQDKVLPRVTRFEEAFGTRFTSALRLAQTPALSAILSEKNITPGEVKKLVELVSTVYQMLPRFLELRDNRFMLQILSGKTDANKDNSKLPTRFRKTVREMYEAISALDSAFLSFDYPFDHAQENITVAGFLLKQLPEPEDPGEVYQACEMLVERLPRFQARILGRLCIIAEAVETELGMEPLKNPEPIQDEEGDWED